MSPTFLVEDLCTVSVGGMISDTQQMWHTKEKYGKVTAWRLTPRVGNRGAENNRTLTKRPQQMYFRPLKHRACQRQPQLGVAGAVEIYTAVV